MKSSRRAKGVNLIGIVKLVKGMRKRRPLRPGALSRTAEAFLDEHVLVSDWYSFDLYVELLQLVFREMLESSEAAALEMGIMGGRSAFSGHHKQFVAPGNPIETLIALRHTWRVYYDFGTLSAVAEGPRSARLVLDGYPDMLACHGNMIVGWHVAAAREAGAESARSEIVKAPWRADERLIHRVTF
jgi:hypothetical protein